MILKDILVVDCHIQFRPKAYRAAAARTMDKLSEEMQADDYEPHSLLCQACGIRWLRSESGHQNWRDITCPNCYSESDLVVTKLRVDYLDLGPQNGGREEMLKRIEHGRRMQLKIASAELLKRTRIMIREWEEVFGTEDENRTPGDVLEHTKEAANSLEKILGKV